MNQNQSDRSSEVSPNRGGLKWLLIVIIIVILGAGAYWYYQSHIQKPSPNNSPSSSQNDLEKSCMNSGGKVKYENCCQSASEFPNSCLVGACGCAPNSSGKIKTCECGIGRCFNGKECIQK